MYPGSLYKSALNTAMVSFPVSKNWSPSQSGLEIVDTSLLAWVIEAVDQLTASSKASTT
jgi:transcription-repair coupling factor (superfamily II helicase)